MEKAAPVHILLVDDREDNLIALTAVLRIPEYHLVSAQSGAQALEYLNEHDFAVILLDVQMPGMDGLETARRVRKQVRSQNTPIILVTGMFPDEAHIRLGYEVGAVDFISKPFDPRVLKCKVAVFVDLFRKTEKIRVQEKQIYESSQSRFQTLFEQSPLGIQLFSPEGELVEVNQSWERILGASESEFAHASPAVHQALLGKPSQLPPVEYRNKWVESFVYPIRNDAGAIREVAVILKDVTDRKSVEEELRKSRDQLQIIFDSVADGIIVHDHSGRVVYANDVGARLLGVPSGQAFMGMLYSEVVAGFEVSDQNGVPLLFDRLPSQQSLRGAREAELICNCRELATGQERWLIVSARPILDEAGKPYLSVGIYRDITQQRRMEENDRFLADTTAALAFSLDYRATMLRVSDLAESKIADVCTVTIADDSGQLRPETADNRADEMMLRVFRTGLSEMHNSEPSGKSLLQVPLRVRDKILGVISLTSTRVGRRYDLTDLVLAEELGRRAGMAIDNARLFQEAQAQRERLTKAVQARDEFISIAGHELKTPLTSLSLHAEMAALQLDREGSTQALGDRLRKFVDISISQIERLSRLIEEMLDVSRIGMGKLTMLKEPLDVCRLVKGVVDDFSEQIRESGTSWNFHGEEELFASCDRYRIEQVVLNLLTNAMKYGEGRPIHLAVVSQGERVAIQVRDEGVGIALEDHERIFQRFERAVSATAVTGLGLGLYIVKEIVGAHEGEVVVESELGQGAIFTVFLPRVAPKA